jgi:hypothetical protein
MASLLQDLPQQAFSLGFQFQNIRFDLIQRAQGLVFIEILGKTDLVTYFVFASI